MRGWTKLDRWIMTIGFTAIILCLMGHKDWVAAPFEALSMLLGAGIGLVMLYRWQAACLAGAIALIVLAAGSMRFFRDDYGAEGEKLTEMQRKDRITRIFAICGVATMLLVIVISAPRR